MHYRPLGRSGLEVSEIGFGTWGLGGTHGEVAAYGPTSDDESVAALNRAFALGVTFYDTSDLYGQGHSESLLGQTFADRRSSVVLTTKAGFVGADQDFSIPHLEEALAGSLDRLRTTHVDLFLLHSPPLELWQRDPALREWLQALKAERKARLVGISVRSPDDGLAVVSSFPVDAIQVNFNLVDQRALDNGLFNLCAARGVGVIVRTPLCFGFLTGSLAGNEEFSSQDHRSRWSVEQRLRWSEAVRLFWDAVQSRQQTPAQYALRFCLSQPGVSTVIPGMLIPAHVDENVAASAAGPLTEREIQQVKLLYQSQSFFVGKT